MQPLLQDVLRRTLTGFADRATAVAPNILAMLIILVAGIVLGGAFRWFVRLGLSAVHFDRFARRSGISVVLEKGGMRGDPSNAISLAFGWFIVGLFVILAIGALNLDLALGLLSRAFLYLPRFLVALAILVLGSMLAAFLRRSVLIAAVNAGLPAARPLAFGVQGTVIVLAFAMALEHLGVGHQVILTSFAILFGGLVLALALAFGLAGRDMAREVLERMAARSRQAEESEDTLRHI
ncbi:MAG: hypothetical protein ACE148_16630 [Vicinamibacterales bacterium]